jgi:hypothetical protein
VSSGESGSGVRIGGGGAFQGQFTRHMYLPVAQDEQAEDPMAPPPPFDPFAPPPPPADPFAPAPAGPGPADIPAVDGVANELPPPPPDPELPPPGPELAPAPDEGPTAM